MPRAKTDRNIQRVVRLSAEEDSHVSTQAAELGLTPATYLRLTALKKLPKVRGVLDREIQKELWKQVTGMARNMNQLTRCAHSGKLQVGELEGLTSEIRRLMTQMMAMAGMASSTGNA